MFGKGPRMTGKKYSPPKHAVLRFADKRTHKAGAVFEVTAIATALFRGKRFQSLSLTDGALVDAMIGQRSQRAAPDDPFKPPPGLPLVALLGTGAEFKWDTAQPGLWVTLLIRADRDVDGFECVIAGDAAPSLEATPWEGCMSVDTFEAMPAPVDVTYKGDAR